MVVLNKRAVEALLADDKVKLWTKDFVLDPLVDPFPACVAAKVLLVEQTALTELIKNNFVSTTCKVGQGDGADLFHFCYWDILEATTFMSLVSLGDQIDCALEDANRIFDLLAHYYEEYRAIEEIDVFMLTEIIMDAFNICNRRNRFPERRLTIVSLKLAIDIMNVHSRCMNHFSSSVPSHGSVAQIG